MFASTYKNDFAAKMCRFARFFLEAAFMFLNLGHGKRFLA